jgi:hypothetical protein
MARTGTHTQLPLTILRPSENVKSSRACLRILAEVFTLKEGILMQISHTYYFQMYSALQTPSKSYLVRGDLHSTVEIVRNPDFQPPFAENLCTQDANKGLSTHL